jgi:hypothetical protein
MYSVIELTELKAIYDVVEVAILQINSLPSDLMDFYKVCDGINGDLEGETSLIIYSSDIIHSRNLDYEVAEYLPEYIMIGDDGGGVAILMHKITQIIYASGMGALDETMMVKISDNLEIFLIDNRANLDLYYDDE